MEKKWECDYCGICCKNVNLVNFPFDRGDGVCKYLNKNNMCDIYENRPNTCRVKDKEKNNDKLILACNFLKKEFAK